MVNMDLPIGRKVTTDDTDIRDGTELVRGEGMPQKWMEGDGLWVVLPSGEEILFAALPHRGENLFSWSSEARTPRLAYLDRVNDRTVRVRLIEGVP